MKWVKASERLPEKEGDYFVIYTTGEKMVLYASGTNHHSRWKALVYEWLDESIEEQAGEKEWKRLGELKEPIEGIIITVMGNGRVFAYDSEHTMAGLKNVIEHHPEVLCLQIKKPVSLPG